MTCGNGMRLIEMFRREMAKRIQDRMKYNLSMDTVIKELERAKAVIDSQIISAKKWEGK